MSTTTAPSAAETTPGGRTGSTTVPKPKRRRWGLTAIGTVLAVVFLVPYLVMLVGSFKSRSEVLRIPATYLPDEWLPGNYVDMWSTPETPLPYNLVSTIAITSFATLHQPLGDPGSGLVQFRGVDQLGHEPGGVRVLAR